MLKMTASVCIEAPAADVWAVLSQLESIHLWVTSIQHSYCPEQSRGVGALRVVHALHALERRRIALRRGSVCWVGTAVVIGRIACGARTIGLAAVGHAHIAALNPGSQLFAAFEITGKYRGR